MNEAGTAEFIIKASVIFFMMNEGPLNKCVIKCDSILGHPRIKETKEYTLTHIHISLERY